MDRMRRLVALSGMVLLGSAMWASPVSAELIRPAAGRAYPDIAADINGVVNYTYNASTQTGNFHMTNTPYLIAGGASSSKEFPITPTSAGLRQQSLNVTLDSQGNLISGPANTFNLYGTVQADGQTYTGLLLSGTPTRFGYKDLDSTGITGVDVFDFDVAITGGELQKFFGTEAYIRLTPELESTFHGKFDTSFTAAKATSNTRSYVSPQPFPVPEPTTLMVLAAGGLGLVQRRRLRRLIAG
jgi:hypothetical protein